MSAINCSAGLAAVVVNLDVAVAEIVLRSWEDLSTTCDERCAVCTGLLVLKLVVLNKDATFRPFGVNGGRIVYNSLDFFGWNFLKSWHFLYRRRREKNFSDLQNFSTRNSPSVFPYLVKLNDNGSYDGLREPIRKLENHYPELKIY